MDNKEFAIKAQQNVVEMDFNLQTPCKRGENSIHNLITNCTTVPTNLLTAANTIIAMQTSNSFKGKPPPLQSPPNPIQFDLVMRLN